jgi:hypothetical protein
VELINTIGTRVHVRDEHAEHLLAAGYTHPRPTEESARPARRTTTRAARRTSTGS